TKRSSWALSPNASITTPDASLRTLPPIPASRATRQTQGRKPTPWTMPRILMCRPSATASDDARRRPAFQGPERANFARSLVDVLIPAQRRHRRGHDDRCQHAERAARPDRKTDAGELRQNARLDLAE